MSERTLRRCIRMMLEIGGGGGSGNAAHPPRQPYSGVGITMADREQMGATMPDPEEEEDQIMAPHLRHVDVPAEHDDLGPVPPENNGDIFGMTDPYAKNWHVLPTPRIYGR